MTRWAVVAASCLLIPGLAAQEGRVFCDPLDPQNLCPGPECACSEDVLLIRFEPDGDALIEIADPPAGLRLNATVILETKSTSVLGWVYEVRHDGRALSIDSVTIEETDAKRLFQNGFNATNSQDLLDCALDPTLCADPQRAEGFISMVILSMTEPVELPLGTNSLVRVAYRVEPGAGEIGKAGILLEFTTVALNVAGGAMRPKTLIDGKVIVVGKSFHRGDPDGDGGISVTDAVALLLFLFLSAPAPGCLEAGDIDDDGRIDTTDPIGILRWLFLEGSAPALPGAPPEPCGEDPPGSWLGCGTYMGC